MPPYGRLHRTLKRQQENTAKSRSVAEAAQRKTKIKETAEVALAHALAPDGVVDDYRFDPRVDDGLPPSAPSGITITPLAHALSIEWTPPLYDERVKIADVSITPDGGSERIERATNLNRHAAIDLESGVPCSVKIKYTDAFGVAGPFSTPVIATPLHSVAEEIDLGEAALLERLHGLLPNENFATLEDATKLGEGVVLAEAMAVQDAAAFNLWASEAMIQSAHIATLEADKIDTGTISAATIFLSATGKLQAGDNTTLDAGGIQLGLADNFNISVQAGSYKISGEGDIGAMMFFAPTPISTRGNHRGVVLRADGVEGGDGGALVLEATAAGSPDVRGARFEVLAKSNSEIGQINAYGDMVMRGDIFIRGRLVGNSGGTTASPVAGSGGTTTFPHTLGFAPWLVQIQVSTDLVTWREAPNSGLLIGTDGISTDVTSTALTVTNNTSTAYYIRCRIIG